MNHEFCLQEEIDALERERDAMGISLQGACHLPLAKVTCALTGLPPEIRQGPRCQT